MDGSIDRSIDRESSNEKESHDFQPFGETDLTSSSQQRLDHWAALLVRDVTSAFYANYPAHAFPVEHDVRFRSFSVGLHVWFKTSRYVLVQTLLR